MFWLIFIPLALLEILLVVNLLWRSGERKIPERCQASSPI
jgi:hypothetical protein